MCPAAASATEMDDSVTGAGERGAGGEAGEWRGDGSIGAPMVVDDW
jgi:hypothetical protein